MKFSPLACVGALAFTAFCACAKEEGPPRLLVTQQDAAEAPDTSKKEPDEGGKPDGSSLDGASDGAITTKLATCTDRSGSVTYIQICKNVSTAIGREVPNSVECTQEQGRKDAINAGCVYDVPDASSGGDLCCPANVRGQIVP